MRLPLFVIGGLKEGKTVVIKKYSTVESREGIPLNSQTFWDMDKVISDGGKKGKHIYTHNLVSAPQPSITVYQHIRLTQKDINLFCSYVNSVKRAALN